MLNLILISILVICFIVLCIVKQNAKALLKGLNLALIGVLLGILLGNIFIKETSVAKEDSQLEIKTNNNDLLKDTTMFLPAILGNEPLPSSVLWDSKNIFIEKKDVLVKQPQTARFMDDS